MNEFKSRIIALRKTGLSANKITGIMRAEGFKSPKGKDLTSQHISNQLVTLNISSRKIKRTTAKPVENKHQIALNTIKEITKISNSILNVEDKYNFITKIAQNI